MKPLLAALVLALASSAAGPSAEELWNRAMRQAREREEAERSGRRRGWGAVDESLGEGLRAWETVDGLRDGAAKREKLSELRERMRRVHERRQEDLGPSPRLMRVELPGPGARHVFVHGYEPASRVLELEVEGDRRRLAADDVATFDLDEDTKLTLHWSRAEGRDALLLDLIVWSPG